MKRISNYFLFSVLLLQFTLCVHAQLVEPRQKFGKPSEEELSMNAYQPDTAAVAVYLLRNGKTKFTYNGGFGLETEYWFRLKILKPQGVKYADVSVPCYAPEDDEQDAIVDINGASYNLENGKVVKTPLKRDLIAHERVSPTYQLVKFSIPNVKEGTVIEYRYTLKSNYYVHIDGWLFQADIPVLSGDYEIAIPSVFIYNLEYRGEQFIKTDVREGTMRALATAETASARATDGFSVLTKEYTFSSRQIPALKADEPFCWCPEDYLIQVNFELQGTDFPNVGYKPFSKRWSDVDNQLLREENIGFGRMLTIQNPFPEDTKSIAGRTLDFEERLEGAFELLKSKLVWDGRYRLYGNPLKDILKKGGGSNADLNFILISILRDLGIQAWPVVLRSRSMGILPIYYPTIQKLSTFVVAVYDVQKKDYVYLDTSMKTLALNVLPLDLSVGRARILRNDLSEDKRWIDLLSLTDNRLTVHIVARLKDDEICGDRTVSMSGHYATEYLEKDTRKSESSLWKENRQMQLDSVRIEKNGKGDISLRESASFRLCPEKAGGRIYLNPMIFKLLEENPFTQVKRELPIEFPYPYQIRLICNLQLPEDYVIEELPINQSVKTESGDLQYTYLIQGGVNQLQVRYIFRVKSVFFQAKDYALLQEMWRKAMQGNEAIIVLKKKDAGEEGNI